MQKMTTPIPSRESVMQQQVGTLLAVIYQLQPLLLEPYRGEVEKLRDRPDLDGGVAASAVATTVAVLDRITALVSNKDNWGLEKLEGLEKTLQALYAENLKATQAHYDLTKLQAQAHNFFKPSFARLGDGRFAAFYSSTNNPNDIIFGSGDTLEEALRDYNRQFKLRQEETKRVPQQPVEEAEVVKDEPPRKAGAKRKGGRK